MNLTKEILQILQIYYQDAVDKHPKISPTSDRLLFMVEEVGEAVQEYNNSKEFNLTPEESDIIKQKFYEELYQVAVTALRIVEEGIR